MTDVEQCNGNTLKGERCRRMLIPLYGINTNFINGLIYCSVHFAFNKKNKENKINRIYVKERGGRIRVNRIKKNNRNVDKIMREYILKNVPNELYNDVKDLETNVLKSIFNIDENEFIESHEKKKNQQTQDKNNTIIQNNINKEEPDDQNIDPTAVFECKCCYCENFMKDMVKCSEKHEFCKECLTKYVTDRITCGDYKLKCMAQDDKVCDGIFSHNILKNILDPNLYKTYCDKETQEIVIHANISDIYTCPKCSIYFAILDEHYKSAMNEPRFECLNIECKHISCYKCKNNFHGKFDCDFNIKNNNVHKVIEEILTKHRTRRCPKCNKEFLRTDGCNKMTCLCKFKSCYVCRSKVIDYSHFQNDDNKLANGKCPLYTNETDIENTSFTSALNEIYETYKYDKIKLLNEVYPILIQLEKEHKMEIDKIILNPVEDINVYKTPIRKRIIKKKTTEITQIQETKKEDNNEKQYCAIQ